MGIKEQLNTLKDNWLMIVLILIVLIFISGSNNIVSQSFGIMKGAQDGLGTRYYDEMVDMGNTGTYMPIINDGNFAPDIEERKVTKSSSLSTEIKRDKFKDSEEKLKNIITSSGAYLLNERVARNGEGWKGYYSGYYSLKVDTEKYASVVSQLKEIGEVQYFDENMDDVTGRYSDLSIEIEVEKQRLARYMEMFTEAKETQYKIELNDRIFDQERRIKYLENSLRNIDNKVEYSTISFTMTEERSEWTNIVFVKLSELIKGFIESINTLLKFIFVIAPWAFAFWIARLVWKKFKN